MEDNGHPSINIDGRVTGTVDFGSDKLCESANSQCISQDNTRKDFLLLKSLASTSYNLQDGVLGLTNSTQEGIKSFGQQL